MNSVSELWNLDPVAIGSLLLFAGLYISGLRHMPKKIRRDAGWFFSGWIALVIALISPIHRLGGWLFSVHMIQHEMLMVAAAPLLILGRPGIVALRALPTGAARGLMHGLEKAGWIELWETITRPGLAWLIHGFALWIWHVPAFFELTFSHVWIHALQHLSFFGSALLFWYSLFRDRREESRFAAGILSLFTTAIHTSVLGALITFSPKPLYPSYIARAPYWGFSALQDQQLGGMIMWVPAGIVYIVSALYLLHGWLRTNNRETDRAIRPVLLIDN
jgi:cytochrome c oxidase assembly factor CtaG